jgi:hypothetical protein
MGTVKFTHTRFLRKKTKETAYLLDQLMELKPHVRISEEGVLGSSTESHISHVLSTRMSSRPMGWSKTGADKLSRLRIYWKNGGSMKDLLNYQKEVPLEGNQTEEGCLTVRAIRDWEKRTTKRNGKYVAGLQASTSSQMQARIYFHSTLSGFL